MGKGIPTLDNEDLSTVFNNICNAIDHSLPIIKSIYRQRQTGQNQRTQRNTTIIAKLYTPTDKNNLLYHASKFRRNNKCTLSLRQAGIDSDEPIYINESLSKTNHAVLKTALQLKKKKTIFAAYSHRGLVYIKKTKNESPVLISSIDSLKMLFGNQELRGNSNLFRNDAN